MADINEMLTMILKPNFTAMQPLNNHIRNGVWGVRERGGCLHPPGLLAALSESCFSQAPFKA